MINSSNFNVFLSQSVDKTKYYAMIGMQSEQLEYACKDNKIQIKLIDSYDYEPFDPDQKKLFEPFRSKQRQQIIEASLQKVVNLRDLKSQKIVQQFYQMHTYGGIYRIKFQWIYDTKWYLPQPLNQMDDYLLEGKSQNFTSVTILRQYFGEKIAFFFGWKSFLTCFTVFIAFPGLGIQIYEFITGQYDFFLIPFWVFYVMLWSTFIVEFWKRKTSEINYRWGTLEQMNTELDVDKQIRSDFIGDECISLETGGLTKHQEKAKTVIVLLISIPFLLILMACIVFIFLSVQEFKNKNPNTLANQTIAGVLQGVGIQVLNYIYVFVAKLFVEYENHKYDEQYERSIIYKIMAFKFINSYFSLYYVAFVDKKSTFETLFQMLLPIMLVKQFNYMILSVWIPKYIQNSKEKKYFKKVDEQIYQQNLIQTNFSEFFDDNSMNDKQDIIEQFWHQENGLKMKTLFRNIIQLPNQSQDDKNAQSEKKINYINNIDIDSVELNALRVDFTDTVSLYADSFIDIGYITLFASAFPIGPMISLLMNTLEINNRLIVLLDIYKRPKFEKCTGINDWMYIWEGLSVISVFSNIALMYVKDESLIKILFDEDQLSGVQLEQYKVWTYLVVGIVIFGLKYMFQVVIQDKPKWILDEEEKENYLKQQQEIANEKIRSKEMQELKLQRKKLIQEKEEKEKKFKIFNMKKTEQYKLLQQECEYYKKNCPQKLVDFDSVFLNNQQDFTSKSNKVLIKNQYFLSNDKLKSEFYVKRLSVLKNTFVNIERELLNIRLKQIIYMSKQPIVICKECSLNSAVLECLNCSNRCFCQECFDSFHNDIKENYHSVNLVNIKYQNLDLQGYCILENNNEEIQSFIQWKKFEQFCLPTFEKSSFHSQLSDIFNLFQNEYIKNNGIEDPNQQININSIFKIQQKQGYKSEFFKQQNEEVQKIIEMEEFNVEDKLFLNRIAFLTFKRYEYANYQNFLSFCKHLQVVYFTYIIQLKKQIYQCKKLNIQINFYINIYIFIQEGNFQRKMLLLLDFLDLNENKQILFDEICNFCYSSFMQNIDFKIGIQNILQELFEDQNKIDKLTIGKKILFEVQENSQIYMFLVQLMQSKI
ncbi:transmembrane protein 16k, putative [Ichthyophthirius multifiliis]|uniref:Transmembrane protein 16k, putative n=1 Tax=Ichthyophthirius multifiliis TaxID=5932 RepID=G0R4V6_ICHMU|nr:transmembrane protein 16k, putative [Ichthyophthirius multifiliis]EGR27499.1 transmembrane protein 16k, putative [Ichthyophthirius multifiliis]|eukprot:XP_004024409.1 transmembrane protein 16k, putative [Ichthyophthirius multifiliis]